MDPRAMSMDGLRRLIPALLVIVALMNVVPLLVLPLEGFRLWKAVLFVLIFAVAAFTFRWRPKWSLVIPTLAYMADATYYMATNDFPIYTAFTKVGIITGLVLLCWVELSHRPSRG